MGAGSGGQLHQRPPVAEVCRNGDAAPVSSCCLLLAAFSAPAGAAAAVPVTQGTPEHIDLLVFSFWCKILRLHVTQALHGSLNPRQHRAATLLYTATSPVQSLLCDIAAGRAESCISNELRPHPFTGLSTMRATCGTVQSLCCPVWTSSGTNTSTWRRCWETCLQRARSLSAGCNGSQTTTVGQPMSRSPAALCLGCVHSDVPAPVRAPC